MKVDFKAVLRDELDGGSMKRPQSDIDMTLGYAVRFSLLYGHPQMQLPPEEHVKRVDLAAKLRDDVVELTAEEIVACKQALSQGWKLSAIVGQCCKLLEGK